MTDNDLGSNRQGDLPTEQADGPVVVVAHNRGGYDSISTVYAYYTATEKEMHGKHCEQWTEFGHRPETAPYRTGKEREFINRIDAEMGGKFASYLISWSGCE